jgi:hypothetical protein
MDKTTTTGATVFSLRMKSTSTCHLSSTVSSSEKLDRIECMQVLHAQDVLKYKCRDYLERRNKRRTHTTTDACDEESIDTTCREKMCEWAYKVCDHFQTSREIVAIAISFLDRFVDRCNVDRTAFKLASMTTVYLATKLFNPKQFSLQSLADLSRGEFEVSHVAEMERILLKTLDWQLNPPTVQTYLSQLHVFLKDLELPLVKAIYERSIFFAELSVYDYGFVTDNRFLIAVACMLNSMEGMDELTDSRTVRGNFSKTALASILCNTATNSKVVDIVTNETLNAAQERLWYLYSCSAQLEHDESLPEHLSRQRHVVPQPRAKPQQDLSQSPISVQHPEGQ